MDYYDEEILEEKREIERQKHTTIETGMYAGEELINFERKTLPNTNVVIPLPKSFVILPEEVRRLKYPSNRAPKFIMSSLDSTVNICFQVMPLTLDEGEIITLCDQCQVALENTNPSIKIKRRTDTATIQGREMSWFEYKGFQIDSQSYNRVYLIAFKKCVLCGTFICQMRDRDKWEKIVEAIFKEVADD